MNRHLQQCTVVHGSIWFISHVLSRQREEMMKLITWLQWMQTLSHQRIVRQVGHYCNICLSKGPGGSMSQVVGLPNNSYKPITNTAWVRAWLYKLQKRYTRLTAASDKVYPLLVPGRWFSPGTPASSTTKTGRHDIAEILLKVALNTKRSIYQSILIIL